MDVVLNSAVYRASQAFHLPLLVYRFSCCATLKTTAICGSHRDFCFELQTTRERSSFFSHFMLNNINIKLDHVRAIKTCCFGSKSSNKIVKK
jgi:hypothetical protein